MSLSSERLDSNSFEAQNSFSHARKENYESMKFAEKISNENDRSKSPCSQRSVSPTLTVNVNDCHVGTPSEHSFSSDRLHVASEQRASSPTPSMCSLDTTSLISANEGYAHKPEEWSRSLVAISQPPVRALVPGVAIRSSAPADRVPVESLLMATDAFQPFEVAASLALFDAHMATPEDPRYAAFTATMAVPPSPSTVPRITGWVAFAESTTPGVFDLRCLAVEEGAQHCGVGSALMDHAELAIQERGGRISVVATPSRASVKSQAFCHKLGYSLEARLRQYYPSGEDRLLFVKHFAASMTHAKASQRGVSAADMRLQLPSTAATWRREHQVTPTEVEEADGDDPALPHQSRRDGVPAPQGTPAACDRLDSSAVVPVASSPSPSPVLVASPAPSVASSAPSSPLMATAVAPALATSPEAVAAPASATPDPCTSLECSRRAPCYANVPDKDWNDYHWQQAHRLTKAQDFEAAGIALSPSERAAFTNPSHLPVSVSPYLVSLMDPTDPACPLRRQFLPTDAELKADSTDLEDSLAEDAMSPVPGIVHRYPDRCLMLVSMVCSAYCRFCTRNRIVGTAHGACVPAVVRNTPDGVPVPLSDAEKESLTAARYKEQIAYIRRTPQIRDVLLSGGDVLLLPTATIDYLLRELRSIPHVQVIRLGSRAPIVLPQRIQPDLVAVLRKYHPLWINVHTNHPVELTPEARRALGMLADAGIPLGNQSVLLAGVNDCPNIQLDLVHKLVASRVRPYYLYQCDEVKGAAHFRTPISKGIEIAEALRGHTSGYANPLYIVDCPHGGGKVPLMPNYLVSQGERRVVLRNYEGFMVAYDNPRQYHTHDEAKCKSCSNHRAKQTAAPADHVQSRDVSSLLMGEGMLIAPEGWHDHHTHQH